MEICFLCNFHFPPFILIKILRCLTDAVKAVNVLGWLASGPGCETPGAINLMARQGRVEDLAHC
jgi:hypothetical protein